MSDETTDETTEAADPEADVEAEEGDVTEPAAPLDMTKLLADAEARYAKGVENGRVDMDTTYCGYLVGLSKGAQEALAAAARAEAERRTKDEAKTGPYNRRRLAVQVAAGTYDAA